MDGFWNARSVGQTVIVVIDALRADFVFERESLVAAGLNLNVGDVPRRPRIPELRQVLEDKEALGFVAVTTPPTVTLPRIKVRTRLQTILVRLVQNVPL